jgi:hypothetical protein
LLCGIHDVSFFRSVCLQRLGVLVVRGRRAMPARQALATTTATAISRCEFLYATASDAIARG